MSLRKCDSSAENSTVLPGASPNVAREIALDLKLDPSCEGMTVTRACASGLQAITIGVAGDDSEYPGISGDGSEICFTSTSKNWAKLGLSATGSRVIAASDLRASAGNTCTLPLMTIPG
jgi:hypothetical protein